MAERLLYPHSATGLPLEATDSTVIRIGQLELADLDPFVLEVGANLIPNLDAEKVGGYTALELSDATLESKKVVEYRSNTLNVSMGENATLVTGKFVSSNVEVAYTTKADSTIEGVLTFVAGNYYRTIVLDADMDYIDDGANNEVFGVTEREVNTDNSVVALTWANGSATVGWAGIFSVGGPINYVGRYLISPDTTIYEVQNYTDNGNDTGTFILVDTYGEVSTANNLSDLRWSIAYYSVDASGGNEYTFTSAQALSFYYPYRTNLKDMNELIGGRSPADGVEGGGGVTQADFNALRSSPVLVDSSAGTIQQFTNFVDVYNLTSSLTIQGSGVSINLGGVTDTVNLETAIAQSLNAINFSINGVSLSVTATELNQLAGISTNVKASNLNKLTGGIAGGTDLHQHALRFAVLTGNVGDVVYINSSNQTALTIADPAVDANGYKVLGVIAEIDGITSEALVVSEGIAPLYVGHTFSDGDEVYLSATTSGRLVTAVPTANNQYVIRVGKIQNSKIIVDVQYLWQN